MVQLPQHALDEVKEIAELLDGLIVTPVQPDVANPKQLVDIIVSWWDMNGQFIHG